MAGRGTIAILICGSKTSGKNTLAMNSPNAFSPVKQKVFSLQRKPRLEHHWDPSKLYESVKKVAFS
jgi:Flp pilus assembly CpaF family ATPase